MGSCRRHLQGPPTSHTARGCRCRVLEAEATPRKSFGNHGLLLNLCHVFTTLSEIWEITIFQFPQRNDEIEFPVGNCLLGINCVVPTSRFPCGDG